MATRRIGIIMHGVTGRIGTNQHLINSVLAIREEGGLALADGDRLMPDPILVGRNPEKLAALAARTGVARWTTDLAAALADPADTVFFDSAFTAGRPALALQAIAAGKHIYLEKPVAPSFAEAMALHHAAEAARVKHAVVQDKLFLPGLTKLRLLREQGFFRPPVLGADRFRLVGVRRPSGAGAALVLELPARRRRRAGARYVPALAIHRGRAVRPPPPQSSASCAQPSPTGGTKAARPSRSMSRMRRARCSTLNAARRLRSTPHGRSGCGGTICSPSPCRGVRAARWRGCIAASPRRWARRPNRPGTWICHRTRTSTRSGPLCPMWWC